MRHLSHFVTNAQKISENSNYIDIMTILYYHSTIGDQKITIDNYKNTSYPYHVFPAEEHHNCE